MSKYLVFHKGSFGARVALAANGDGTHVGELDIERLSTEAASLSPGGRIVIALSAPNFILLQRIGNLFSRQSWIAVFPFGANLVITPMFGSGRACVRCFCKRFVSNPPQGIQQEATAAFVEFCGNNPQFEQTAFHDAAARIAGQLSIRNLSSNAEVAVLWGSATFMASSAHIVPLHGCDCRGSDSIAGAHRFTSFSAELPSWMN